LFNHFGGGLERLFDGSMQPPLLALANQLRAPYRETCGAIT